MFVINREKFAIRLNELLKSKKITPETLSDKIGVGLPSVKNWLKGNSLPSVVNLEKICKLTKTHENKLLYGSVEELIDDRIDYIIEKYEFIDSKDDLTRLVEQHNITINNIEKLETKLIEMGVQASIFRIREAELLANIYNTYGPLIAITNKLLIELDDKDKLIIIQNILSMINNNEVSEDLSETIDTINKEMPIAMSNFSNRNKK